MKKTPDRLLNETFFKDDLPIKLDNPILTKSFELHWHEFYELTFVLSGDGINIVNGVSLELKPGDLFLLTPADFHEISPSRGQTLQLYNLIFSQQMLSDEMVHLLFSEDVGRYARFHDQEKYESMLFRFKCIQYENDYFAAGRKISFRCELERVLIEWHRHRQKSSESTYELAIQKNDFPYALHYSIEKSLIYIQHHFRQQITLKDAARQSNLSPNYFSELFRKSTGVTFQHHLQQLRLRCAHSLLRASQLTVTEICYASGFNTLTHFEKVFRQHFGMTPREARKNK